MSRFELADALSTYMTPLQEKSYELLVRVTSLNMIDGDDWRIKRLRERLLDDALLFGSEVQTAVCASDKVEFQMHLHFVHDALRQVKLWLKLLDDLGFIEPEAALPLSESAEEVHRLVLAALKTVSNPKQQLRYGSDDRN